jgi:CDP-paratose synthetase
LSKSKKTILITGGTGYLGSNIALALCEDYEIIILKRSFSPTKRIEQIISKIEFFNIDEVNLKNIFLHKKIDTVLHCATHYGRKSKEPLEIVEANLVLPLALLNLAKEYAVPSFINTDTILDKGINAYSLSKSHFNDWFRILAADIVCVNMELEHFYGPLDDSSKFVTHLIHSILKNKSEVLLTKGEQKRHFVYIDDVVNAFRLIIAKISTLSKGYHSFQIGDAQGTSVRAFVEMVKLLAGNERTFLNFGAIPYRDKEVMYPDLDISRILKFGWSIDINLEEGLQRTIVAEKEHLST